MIDFPASPTDQQIFSASNGVVYKYSATYSSWLAQNPTPPLGGTGDFCAILTSGGSFGTTPSTLILTTVLSGNSGLWYNSTSTGRYTPPAGRYCLYAAMQAICSTVSSNMIVGIYKNGALLQQMAATSTTTEYANPSLSLNVDANGADYFEMKIASQQANGTLSAAVFQAFPLTGMQGPTGLPGPPGGVTATSSVRQVTNRAFLPNVAFNASTIGAATACSFTRCWQMSYVPISALSVGVANWYMNSGVETSLGGTTTWKVWVEYPQGTYTQLLWSGATSIVSAATANLYTDLTTLPTQIPAFTRFWLWIGKNNPTSGALTNFTNVDQSRDYGSGDISQTGNSTQTPGTITDDGNVAYMCFPIAVMAMSNKHVWCSLGDSILVGTNEDSQDPSGGRGYFGRALAAAGFPQLNMGVVGDQAGNFVASHTLRNALIASAGVDRAILDLGANDIYSGISSATALASRDTIRAYYTFPVFDTTLTPITNSSDTWKTAANQTQVNTTYNTQRTSFNTSIRSFPRTRSAGYVDIASVVETDTAHEITPVLNGGVWLPYNVNASTGSYHPCSQGYANPVVQQKILNLINLAGP